MRAATVEDTVPQGEGVREKVEEAEGQAEAEGVAVRPPPAPSKEGVPLAQPEGLRRAVGEAVLVTPPPASQPEGEGVKEGLRVLHWLWLAVAQGVGVEPFSCGEPVAPLRASPLGVSVPELQ